MKVLDILILGMDIFLFGYFGQIAFNTSSMTIRIFSCLAITTEIFFMRQHLKVMKLRTENEE